jgi:hypothetical protein
MSAEQLLRELEDHVTTIIGRKCQEFLMNVKQKYLE